MNFLSVDGAYLVGVTEAFQTIVKHVVVGCGDNMESQKLQNISIARRQPEIKCFGGGLLVVCDCDT